MRELFAMVAKYGVPLVFLNVLAEQLGLPIPAIPTLIVAGALVIRRDFSAGAVLAAAILASLIADSVWYVAGRRRGHRILKTLCKISLSPDSCVRQTEDLYDRWGNVSLVFAKFVPGLSTIAPPLAGASRTPFGLFLLFDAFGAFLWAGAGVILGVTFHHAIDRAMDILESIGSWAVVAVVSILALFILLKWVERRQFYKALRMSRITPDELRDLIARGKGPVVFDARSESARSANPRRIPGALVFRPEELPSLRLDRSTEIALYCT
jgi:membrane protein DedA with SNARE-associated domain